MRKVPEVIYRHDEANFNLQRVGIADIYSFINYVITSRLRPQAGRREDEKQVQEPAWPR